MKIARAIPVRAVKLDTKIYYNISVGQEIVWVHPALIESNMVVLKGERFYFDMNYTPNNSINYYLYPGKNKITAIQSMKYLYILNGSKWFMSEHNGTFYYFIEHNEETLTVHNRIETFEIRDNKIISVEKHAVHSHIDKEIDLDGEW